MKATPEAVPVSAAMPHAPTTTTRVRSAVATVELIVATAAFARTDVNPANKADKQAATIHIPSTVRPAAHETMPGTTPILATQPRPRVYTPPLFTRLARPEEGKPATICG